MKRISAALCYVLYIHAIGLVLMGGIRMILLLSNLKQIELVDKKLAWISEAFLRGLWLDNVIASYITALPLLVLCIVALFDKLPNVLIRIFNGYYILLYSLVFLIGIADIPYFGYFFKHLNVSIFNWSEEGGTAVGMIFQEVSYYIYMFLYIVAIALFIYALLRISRKVTRSEKRSISGRALVIYIPLSCLLFGLCFVGIRGRLGYNPIKTSQAYFCTNSFLNQLGINPSFYFMRDVIESSKSHLNVDKLISLDDATTIVRASLGITEAVNKDSFSIIARQINSVENTDGAQRMNVVLVLMESMSADLLQVKEHGKEITPYLNQLIAKSYYFDNFYSAGTHTNQGITSTLYGMPSLFDRNMMKDVNIMHCAGLPDQLKKNGYSTMFFMPHESQYDNMNAFLTENGFTHIFGEEDYPASERKNSFGVADDFLFGYALGKLNETAQSGKPFFATILTVSNHPPYIVPEKYKSVSNNPEYQIVAFADDAIRQFMEDARKQEWSKNTIFVLLGDHGKIVGTQIYPMPLSYNHIPLIIHAPALLADSPQRLEQLGGQIDVYPTIMDLLNISYVDESFGQSLFGKKRDYIYFSSDDALGCVNDKFFYTYNLKTSDEGLYNYKKNESANLISGNRALADTMRINAAAMFRVAADVIAHKRSK